MILRTQLSYGYIMFASTDPIGDKDDFSELEVQESLDGLGIPYEYVIGYNSDNEYFSMYFVRTFTLDKLQKEELLKMIEALGQIYYYRSIHGVTHEMVSIDGSVIGSCYNVEIYKTEKDIGERGYFCSTDKDFFYFGYNFKSPEENWKHFG